MRDHEWAGYDLHYTYNLTHPSAWEKIFCKKDLDAIRWCILKQPRYMGEVYRKDFPEESFWKESDEYFTFYKGRGRKNKGDRMVNFYMKAPAITAQLKRDVMEQIGKDWEEANEPLY